MAELRVCMRVYGLAVNEDGSQEPVGLQVSLGDSEEDIPYEQLVSALNIPALLKGIGLDIFASESDVEIISPEEYDIEFDSISEEEG